MALLLEAESKLTERFQTTVPTAVRNVLRLGRNDRIHYTIREDGVLMTRAGAAKEPDTALDAFLTFLERDIATHPQHIQPMTAPMAKRVGKLVKGVDRGDRNAPLPADEE